MKTVLISLAVISVLVIVLQSFSIISTIKTEKQKYNVIQKYKDFEIRYYPAATIASTTSAAKTYKELSGPGFRKLAGYIFGGNASNTAIAMTTPVHMDINDSVSTMSFVMPSAYDASNLPVPNDPNVLIQKTAPEYVAAIAFGGYASDKDLKLYSTKLEALLKEKNIQTHGHYRLLGYNPPFQLTGRRNEVIVSVDWKDKK